MKRASTRWSVLAAATASALVLSGCSQMGQGGEDAATAAEECTDVTFLVAGVNPWGITMTDAAQKKGEELGAKVTVQEADFNVSDQIAQIQQAVASNVSGILLHAVEADGVLPAIQQANAAGIPVVTVSSGVADGADVVTFVGVDNYDYGVGLANLAKQALPDGGNVALIQAVAGNPVEVARTSGVLDTLAEADGIKVVAQVTDDWSNDKNLAAVQDLLNKYPKGELDAVIAEGPQIYVGAEYARSIGRDDVAFIAGDFPVQVKEGIESGAIFGAVLQDGAIQGDLAITALCDWIEGREDQVEQPKILVDMPLVTKENVADYPTAWNW